MKLGLIAVVATCLVSLACADLPARSPAVARADGDSPVVVRAEGGRLWWSHHPWSEPHALWQLPGHGAVEELRVTPVASRSEDCAFVVSFEQGGAVYHGRFGFDAASEIDAPSTFLARDHDVGSVAVVDDLARAGR